MAVPLNLAIQTPDVAAAIQLASALAQAGCDVGIEPQSGLRYGVRGTAQIAPAEICSLVTAWIEREQICCAELVLGHERELFVPTLDAPVSVAA
jgi:hypothetical protein